MYELYSYDRVNDRYICDYVLSFNSLENMTKYIDEHRKNRWLFIDNSGKLYAEFDFSEKELKDIILPIKKQKYIKKFGTDGKTARVKAEEECIRLCAKIARIKEEKRQR